jgi:SAM-dependent methyltransferase
MTSPSLEQTPEGWGPGAEQYAQVFAPFTGSFAADAVERLDIGPTHAVLDVAAGSGAFSLRAAERGATVLATDFAAGMLAALAERVPPDRACSVRTAVMDGQALTVGDDSFDAAVSMFGLIFFPDMSRGMRELARVTRSTGRMAIGSWRNDAPRLSRLVGQAVQAAAPGTEVPVPMLHPLGSVEGCRNRAAAAGWRDVEVHTLTHDLVVGDPHAFFHSLSEWSAPILPLVSGLDTTQRAAAADAFAAIVSRSSERGDRVPFSALLTIGAPA